MPVPDYANGTTIAEYWPCYNVKTGLANSIVDRTTYAFYTVPYDGFLYAYACSNFGAYYGGPWIYIPTNANILDSLNIFIQTDAAQDETQRNDSNLPLGYIPFWERFYMLTPNNYDNMQVDTTIQAVRKGDRIAVNYQYDNPPAQWRIIMYPIKATKY